MTQEEMQQFKEATETKGTTTGKMGQASDVAEAYLYVMKDRNCTGAVIDTNGGAHLVGP